MFSILLSNENWDIPLASLFNFGASKTVDGDIENDFNETFAHELYWMRTKKWELVPAPPSPFLYLFSSSIQWDYDAMGDAARFVKWQMAS